MTRLRKLLRIACYLVTAVLLCGLIAYFWPNAGYDRANVHPRLLALQEPYQFAGANYYLDGGTVTVHFIDANERDLRLTLPYRWRDNGAEGRDCIVWDTLDPAAARDRCDKPLTSDELNFIIAMLDKYAAKHDWFGSILTHHRFHPRDFMRSAWMALWYTQHEIFELRQDSRYYK